MKRIAVLFSLLLALTVAASAQMTMTGVGGGFGAGAAAYTGPGDVQSWVRWGGLRAFSAATRGTKAINLCDNTGANCADISTNAVTGVLNNPGTLGANNCNTSGTCLIHTFYDKSGSALDCVQATVASMAALNMTSGPAGNTPAALFVRANSVTYDCSTETTGTQPFTYVALAERTGTTGSFNTVIGSGGPDMLFNSSANGCGIYAGTVFVDTTHCADNSFHAIQGMFSNAASKIYIDGNSTTGTAGTGVSTNNYIIGNGIGGLLDGRVGEFGVANGDQSANFSTLNGNIHTFWGF